MVSSVRAGPVVTQDTAPSQPPRGESGFREAMARAAPASEVATQGIVGKILGTVASGQREMDRIIRLAQGGRKFSPAQLIGLQVRVYRLSQELDLASKLVEKATSGVKQAMSTQV